MDIVNLLQKMGYHTAALDNESRLAEILSAGLTAATYRHLIVWLTDQIKQAGEIDEEVSSTDDLQCFALELSSFLKELNCPYRELLQQPLADRFRTVNDACLVVDFLAGELAFLQISKQKLKLKSQITAQPNTSPAAILKQICSECNVSDNFTYLKDLYESIYESLSSSTNLKLLFNPKNDLTSEQWEQLERIHTELQMDQNIRLQMMLKRLELTVSCFQWKPNSSDEVARVYRQKRRALVDMQCMLISDISDLLSADDTLLQQERISSTRMKGIGRNAFSGYLDLPNRGGIVNIDSTPLMPRWSSREEGQPSENLRVKNKNKPKEQKESDVNVKSKSKRKKNKGSDVLSGDKTASAE
ncbi:protein FAM98B-like [Wyeomyia smithii]|uniref:protein FAM98B-like n=1 Tax=Wyeomyia smithii TaxID=174621 RepID=UPI0024681FAA|nr:protein FAM98B-like [Wyeomyia smithii]